MLGAHFGTYFPPYGGPAPPPHTPLLATPRAHHHASAFCPPSLVYWPYPSPPVSPTTYYSQPGAHSPSQHQAMYPMDFLPTNFTPSPLSPPTVAIPRTSAGLILTSSPNKNTAANMSFVPTTPKQFSTTATSHNNNNNNNNSNKLASPPASVLNGTEASQQAPALAPTSNLTMSDAALTQNSQNLLSIDTKTLQAGEQSRNPTGSNVSATATPLVSNACVELFIS